MRRVKPNRNQYDLDFGSQPPKEAQPVDPTIIDSIKETPKPAGLGAVYKRIADDDRDEDPQAQRAREWKEWGRRRRA